MLLLNFISLFLLSQVAQRSAATEEDWDCSVSKWSQFKEKFGKRYESGAEDSRRRGIFCDKLRWIVEQNSRNLTYKVGINQFSAMNQEEITSLKPVSSTDQLSLHIPIKKLDNSLANSLVTDEDPPERMDWRSRLDVVGPVKNQGECGSCWAFGAVALLESYEHRHVPNLTRVIPLSEQQLIDCDPNSAGCEGGITTRAGDYICQLGGLQTLQSYKYESGITRRAGRCRADKSRLEPSSQGCTGYYLIEQGDEDLLKRYVAFHGPVLVSFYASERFMGYKSGVVYDTTCNNATKTNHAVLLVGYGYDSSVGLDYWILKNSWGTWWGLDGYFHLARNKNNHCLVASKPIIIL